MGVNKMKILRNIVEIDEDLCNGCGQCILDCAEGAMRLENGKAKVISDNLCDGLGACIGGCPTGALKIIQREADPFDLEEVEKRGHHPAPAAEHSCPGSRGDGAFTLAPMTAQETAAPMREHVKNPEAWPLKLRLVGGIPAGSDILLVADCAAPLLNDFRTRYAKNRRVITMCPKFEDSAALAAKLAGIMKNCSPRSITTLRVSVPCCRGVAGVCSEALNMSGANIPRTDVILTPEGEELKA